MIICERALINLDDIRILLIQFCLQFKETVLSICFVFFNPKLENVQLSGNFAIYINYALFRVSVYLTSSVIC